MRCCGAKACLSIPIFSAEAARPVIDAGGWNFSSALPVLWRSRFMLNLIKLCVGVDSLQELADWQQNRLREKRARGQKPELIHVTRQTPRRVAELLDGGSLYWVIKGQIMARQTLLELREMKKNGVPHCGLVYDKKLVPVRPRPRRAFQGWRYFEPKDAPPDMGEIKGGKGLPENLKRELASLGLL
jgi:hypothetical protein